MDCLAKTGLTSGMFGKDWFDNTTVWKTQFGLTRRLANTVWFDKKTVWQRQLSLTRELKEMRLKLTNEEGRNGSRAEFLSVSDAYKVMLLPLSGVKKSEF